MSKHTFLSRRDFIKLSATSLTAASLLQIPGFAKQLEAAVAQYFVVLHGSGRSMHVDRLDDGDRDGLRSDCGDHFLTHDLGSLFQIGRLGFFFQQGVDIRIIDERDRGTGADSLWLSTL